MKLRTPILITALAAAFTASAFAAAPKEVKISAKNFAFSPAVVTLKVDQPVKLEFAATEGMHGITIPDLGVNQVINIGQSPQDVVVTPKKVGTFTSHCALFCGIGHANMVVTFKVVK